MNILSGAPNPLIVKMSADDRLRMSARNLADLLGLYARLLFRCNPRTEGESDPMVESRRELAGAILGIETELRGMCVVSALHEEAQSLTVATSRRAQ